MLPSRAPHHLHPLPMPPTFPRGHPSTAFPPELGAAGVGGGGGDVAGEHLFPTSLQNGGGYGGAVASCSSVCPPLSPPLRSEPDSRHRYRLRWPRRGWGGGTHATHEQLRTHGHDTHPTYRQTATQTALAGSPARRWVKSRLPGQGGVGGCVFWLPCFKSSGFPGQQSTAVTGTPPHASPAMHSGVGEKAALLPRPRPQSTPQPKAHL